LPDALLLVEVGTGCFMTLLFTHAQICQRNSIWRKKSRQLWTTSMKNFSSWRIWWKQRYTLTVRFHIGFHGYSSFLLLAWPLLIVERHIINVKPLWITYSVIYQTWPSDIDTLSRLGRGGLREDTSSWRNFWKSSMKNGMDELDKR